MSGPLTGLRVIEMQGLGPAPLAGQFLADLGAEVTLIARRSGPADSTDINNRGKRSVASQMDTADWSARRAQYAEVSRQKTRDEWATIFDGTDACATPVLTRSEAPDHPHLAQRGTFTGTAGLAQSAPAPRFARNRLGDPGTPPAPGSDTEGALAEVGYSAQDLARLRAEGVLTDAEKSLQVFPISLSPS